MPAKRRDTCAREDLQVDRQTWKSMTPDMAKDERRRREQKAREGKGKEG